MFTICFGTLDKLLFLLGFSMINVSPRGRCALLRAAAALASRSPTAGLPVAEPRPLYLICLVNSHKVRVGGCCRFGRRLRTAQAVHGGRFHNIGGFIVAAAMHRLRRLRHCPNGKSATSVPNWRAQAFFFHMHAPHSQHIHKHANYKDRGLYCSAYLCICWQRSATI